MTRLLILASMLFVSVVFAQVEIPHVHENGDVIDADEINKNLDIVAKAVPPQDCSKDQIIKWDGSAWVCSSLTHVVKDLRGKTEGVISCPSGKKVTGGGCDMDMRDCDITGSSPLGDNGIGLPKWSAWYCAAAGQTDEDYCELNFGYAICQ